MEPLLLLPAALVALMARVWLKRAGRMRRTQLWLEVARASALTDLGDMASGFGVPQLAARAGVLEVLFEEFGPDGDPGTRIVVTPPKPVDVTMMPDGLTTFLATEIVRGEIDVGDRPFDDAFWINGTPLIVHAFLDADTRHRLLELRRAGRVEVRRGELRLELLDGDDDLGRLIRCFPDVLACVGRLSELQPAVLAVARNAREDPVPRVRLNNLNLLVRELRDDPETEATLRAACTDESDLVRLHAAVALGPSAQRVLLDVAERDSELAAQALAVMDGVEAPLALVSKLLLHARHSYDFQTARECIRLLGRRGGDDVLPILLPLLEDENEIVAGAAAIALGAIARPAAEPALIAALGVPSSDVRVAAAQALGKQGSRIAIVPLKEAAGLFHERSFRVAVREAVAEILQRSDISAGELSMTTPDAGQLALADPVEGKLSLPTAQPGRVSLADARPVRKKRGGKTRRARRSS
jgi:hypothetical protein